MRLKIYGRAKVKIGFMKYRFYNFEGYFLTFCQDTFFVSSAVYFVDTDGQIMWCKPREITKTEWVK